MNWRWCHHCQGRQSRSPISQKRVLQSLVFIMVQRSHALAGGNPLFARMNPKGKHSAYIVYFFTKPRDRKEQGEGGGHTMQCAWRTWLELQPLARPGCCSCSQTPARDKIFLYVLWLLLLLRLISQPPSKRLNEAGFSRQKTQMSASSLVRHDPCSNQRLHLCNRPSVHAHRTICSVNVHGCSFFNNRYRSSAHRMRGGMH